MKGKWNTLFCYVIVIFIFGVVTSLVMPPAHALDEEKCERLVDETIRLLKKNEILSFNGKKMIAALEDYKDGIDRSEFRKMDDVLGPFDDKESVLRTIFKNIQEIKEVCD